LSWYSAAFLTLNEEETLIKDIWVLGDMDGLKNQIGAPREAETAF
jgi:hypothetical protein